MDDQKVREAFLAWTISLIDKWDTIRPMESFKGGYRAAYSELKAENERMRCCGNCRHKNDYSSHLCIYSDCRRGHYDGKTDNWEMKE